MHRRSDRSPPPANSLTFELWLGEILPFIYVLEGKEGVCAETVKRLCNFLNFFNFFPHLSPYHGVELGNWTVKSNFFFFFLNCGVSRCSSGRS